MKTKYSKKTHTKKQTHTIEQTKKHAILQRYSGFKCHNKNLAIANRDI